MKVEIQVSTRSFFRVHVRILASRATQHPPKSCSYIFRAGSATFLHGCVCTTHNRRTGRQQERSRNEDKAGPAEWNRPDGTEER